MSRGQKAKDYMPDFIEENPATAIGIEYLSGFFCL
jgi:hypothetical protein